MHGKRMNDARQRKEHILQSAQKVFLKKGYYGATIDEIAAEEGVVRGTILHYFKSKEELMQNVLKNAGKEFVSEIEQLMSNEKTICNRPDRNGLETMRRTVLQSKTANRTLRRRKHRVSFRDGSNKNKNFL